MTLQLQGVPSSLEALVPYLSDDADIKNKIGVLISDARTLSDRFIDTMANNGTEVLHKKNELMIVSNPSKVEVDNLKLALNAMQGELKTVEEEMFIFQAKVHGNIEDCRARIRQHTRTIDMKKIEVNKLEREIKDFERRISDCEIEARVQDQSADNCEEEARGLNRQADEIRETGLKASGLVLGAGILFAPFTGGSSLVLASGATIGGLGGILYRASELDEKARNHRQHANRQRSEAERLRQTKSGLERQKVDKEIEVSSLVQKNEKLSDTCKKLNEIELQLLSSISVINILTTNVQNLDTTLYATDVQGDSFRIIQNAFIRNPQKLEGRAQLHLNKLKEKWECIEPELKQALELKYNRHLSLRR